VKLRARIYTDLSCVPLEDRRHIGIPACHVLRLAQNISDRILGCGAIGNFRVQGRCQPVLARRLPAPSAYTLIQALFSNTILHSLQNLDGFLPPPLIFITEAERYFQT
jgi:hypothetical protein